MPEVKAFLEKGPYQKLPELARSYVAAKTFDSSSWSQCKWQIERFECPQS